MRQRNGRVPLLIIASLTGACVSVGSGMLMGGYATSGINPLDAAGRSYATDPLRQDAVHSAIWGPRTSTDEPTTPAYEPEQVAMR